MRTAPNGRAASGTRFAAEQRGVQQRRGALSPFERECLSWKWLGRGPKRSLRVHLTTRGCTAHIVCLEMVRLGRDAIVFSALVVSLANSVPLTSRAPRFAIPGNKSAKTDAKSPTAAADDNFLKTGCRDGFNCVIASARPPPKQNGTEWPIGRCVKELPTFAHLLPSTSRESLSKTRQKSRATCSRPTLRIGTTRFVPFRASVTSCLADRYSESTTRVRLCRNAELARANVVKKRRGRCR